MNAVSPLSRSASEGATRRRICVVVPTHWAALMGGSQYQTKLLIEHLAETGRYEIHYLAHRTLAGFTADSHQVHRIGRFQRLRRYTDLVDAWSLYRTLTRLEPELIYHRAASGYTGVAARYAASRGIPMIWHVASDIEVLPFDRPVGARTLPKYLEKRAIEYGLRRARRVVVQTQHQRTLLQRHYQRSDAVVVRNFHPLPTEAVRREEKTRVLWVANLKPIKRPELFIRLADRFRHRADIEFTMIGDISDRGTWQSLLSESMARCPNLRFLGRLPQQEVNRQLAAGHVLVNTSENEGFSNTFIQAWMRGVPVVSLTVDPDRLLNEGQYGYCAEGDFEALVARVDRLARDRGHWAVLSARIAEESRRTFSMSNVAKLTEILEGELS
jgi:glycosyltransferase involved in cell wall biosynthesis